MHDPGLVFATDASGGPGGKDPRLRRVAWAVEGLRKEGQHVEQVGSISGLLPTGASVYRGEGYAVEVLLCHTSGEVDLTGDCLGVCRQIQNPHKPAPVDPAWTRFVEERGRIKCTWVKSHLSLEAFVEKFGEEAAWRRQANQAADALCGALAASWHDPAFAKRIRAIDILAAEVSIFLGERIQILQKGIKTDPHPVHFLSRAARKAQRASQPSAFDKEAPKLNKRQRLEALLSGENSLGHAWKCTSRSTSNMTLRCASCDLGAQQTHPPAVFDRFMRQACKGQGELPHPWEFHPSHEVVNAGKCWECSRCAYQQPIRSDKVADRLAKPCEGLGRHSRVQMSHHAIRGIARGQQTLNFGRGAAAPPSQPKISSAPVPIPVNLSAEARVRLADLWGRLADCIRCTDDSSHGEATDLLDQIESSAPLEPGSAPHKAATSVMLALQDSHPDSNREGARESCLKIQQSLTNGSDYLCQQDPH